jgi:ATP-dependent RNA helicase RhlE
VAALRRGAEIVVACPGRLLDHLGDRTIDLSHVEVLVLDEADRMCDMGFLPDIRRILNQLPTARQTLFFSATMPDEIRTLADSILRQPVTVQIDVIAPAKTVSHALYPVPEMLKSKLLLAQLQQVATGRVLIFTRTKHRARNLATDLSNRGYRVAALQGNMAQNQRQRAIDGFRRGEFDILVATDIAARGIDVADISHVINYDMPDTVDAYIHRSGRTGRAQLTGEAFTLTVPADEKTVREIERALGTQLERRRLPNFDYGAFVPEKPPTVYPTTPEAGKYNSRSLGHGGNRTGGNNSYGNNGHSYGQRPANGYAPRSTSATLTTEQPAAQPTDYRNRGASERVNNGASTGAGNSGTRRRPSRRYLQR